MGCASEVVATILSCSDNPDLYSLIKSCVACSKVFEQSYHIMHFLACSYRYVLAGSKPHNFACFLHLFVRRTSLHSTQIYLSGR